MEKLNILDVLLTYKNDSDKIAILGKAIEMIIDYTDKISKAFTKLNTNVSNIAKAVMALNEEVGRINGDLSGLKNIITTNISKLEDTVATNISRLEDTVKETSQRPTGTAGVEAPAASHQRTSIVEESLLKPSQIGSSLAPGPSPLGGGMSIRGAMMAEIKQRIRGSSGEDETTGAGSSSSEIGGGYVPQIHQPREAKSLQGGLVSKMNKLLDAKFQKVDPAGGNPPSGPPAARSAPPRGAPPRSAPPRGPPSAPPAAPPAVSPRPPPIAPPVAPSAAPPAAPFTTPSEASSQDENKKKEKKKDKKRKGKKDSQLNALEKKIREKLG